MLKTLTSPTPGATHSYVRPPVCKVPHRSGYAFHTAFHLLSRTTVYGRRTATNWQSRGPGRSPSPVCAFSVRLPSLPGEGALGRGAAAPRGSGLDWRPDSSPKAQLAPAVPSAPHAPGLPTANRIRHKHLSGGQPRFSPRALPGPSPFPARSPLRNAGLCPAVYSPTSSSTCQDPSQPLRLTCTLQFPREASLCQHCHVSTCVFQTWGWLVI